MATSQKKILILSTFPILRAHHGGSKRVKAIVEAYQGHFSEVKFVAVFSRFAYPLHGRHDIPVSVQTDRTIKKNREFEDVICGRAIYDDPKVREQLRKLIGAMRPDIIQVEQIYPYLGLKRLLAEFDDYRPKIVLSAHNVESKMKREVYTQLGRGLDVAQELEVLEAELARHADLAIAVSAADASALRQLGATNVIVAPNGIAPYTPAAKDIAYWQKRFDAKSFKHTFGFVSSAHLPNWHGFLEVVGNALGFLTFDERIVMAGSLSDYVVELYKKPKSVGEVTFWQRAYPAGRLTEQRLTGLLGAVDVILLPIVAGGGSNLKTAEAIVSGKKIVATRYAFRAYENFLELPNVWIADDALSFREAMRAAIESPYQPLTPEQRSATHAVYWQNCLKDLTAEVTKL